jgi:hypothetical protein
LEGWTLQGEAFLCSNSRFYGLGGQDKLQFYEGICYAEVVEAPAGAADTGPAGGRWFSRVGPDMKSGEVPKCPIRRTTFAVEDWDS